MNSARYIHRFRLRLAQAPDYREARRDFHECYEWLEGYWRAMWGDQGFSAFCRKMGPYFWADTAVRQLAGALACEGPIGNSRRNYQPNDDVISATLYLLNEAGIVSEEARLRCTVDVQAHCGDGYDPGLADGWRDDGFWALMILLRQIRNNLFHGRKIELESPQYERNKRLVTLARDITTLLLAKLAEVERSWKQEKPE